MNQILKKAAEIFVFEPANYGGMYDSVHELHQLYAPITGVSAKNIADEDIYLPSGKAISPTKAAHCLLELARTAVFVRGVYKAITQLKKDFPNQRLHILYAGCGPYATLLTPLTTLFTPGEVAFHLMDINEDALAAVKKLYSYLELDNYVAEWICADAAIYHVPVGETRHLIISETMANALQREPQVEIMLNLIPQLPQKGLFVPEEITVSAKLMNSGLEARRLTAVNEMPQGIDLGTIYSIGTNNAARHTGKEIAIPANPGVFDELFLLTNITTFGDDKLTLMDCSLNIPIFLYDVQSYTGRRLYFQYRMGEVPGFEYDWVD